MTKKDQIFKRLEEVIDPELNIDIVSLGFIYKIEVEGSEVEIEMTLTTPGCPLIDTIEKDIKDALYKDGYHRDKVKVNLTFDPPWTTDMMTERARLELNIL